MFLFLCMYILFVCCTFWAISGTGISFRIKKGPSFFLSCIARSYNRSDILLIILEILSLRFNGNLTKLSALIYYNFGIRNINTHLQYEMWFTPGPPVFVSSLFFHCFILKSLLHSLALNAASEHQSLMQIKCIWTSFVGLPKWWVGEAGKLNTLCDSLEVSVFISLLFNLLWLIRWYLSALNHFTTTN